MHSIRWHFEGTKDAINRVWSKRGGGEVPLDVRESLQPEKEFVQEGVFLSEIGTPFENTVRLVNDDAGDVGAELPISPELHESGVEHEFRANYDNAIDALGNLLLSSVTQVSYSTLWVEIK